MTSAWVVSLAFALFVGPPPLANLVPVPDAPVQADVLAVLEVTAEAQVDVIVETRGSPADAALLAREHGLEVGWTYDLVPAFSGRVDRRDLEWLRSLPDVETIWWDRPVAVQTDVSTADVQASRVWNTGRQGVGVTVAVIDTGVDVTDLDLLGAVAACVATVGGVLLPECDDLHGHGTHVAGTVASRHATFPGVAPGANLAVLRVLNAGGMGTIADVIAGIDWVASHKDTVLPPIRVATMSIGYADPGCGSGADVFAKAADALVATGVSFTVAAGNAGHAKCTIDGAAAAFDVITVGAADDRGTPEPRDDAPTAFSSGGSLPDGRIKPEIVAPGVDITSLGLGPFLATASGTSMATPHVAGILALLFEKEPGLTPAEAKQRLLSTTFLPRGSGPVPNGGWGFGLANACSALRLHGCHTPPVHVASLVLAHAGAPSSTTGRILVTVFVEDPGGRPVRDVDAGVILMSPQGHLYPLLGRTGGRGAAFLALSIPDGGHGAWTACVMTLGGDYDAASNVRTCERRVVA